MKRISTKVRFLLSLLALVIFLFGVAQADYQSIGVVTAVQPQEQGLLLQCGSDQVKIEIVQANIIRVVVGRNGQFEPEHSYAVIRQQSEILIWQWQDLPDQIRITTTAGKVEIAKSPCRLAFYDAAGNLLNRDEPAFGMGWDGDEVACYKSLRPEEQFFGLGEKTGNLNKRGSQYVMWNSDVPAYTNVQDPLYQSHPFFIGRTSAGAYGIFFDNTYRSRFNLGASNDRFYFFAAAGGEIDYYFIFGADIKQVIQNYTGLVGRMPLPPKWALGYQQCRWSYYPENEVRKLAQTFRDKAIPCDVIYLDIHYMDGYRVFTWDRNRFPQPAEMLDDLQHQGFKVVVIIDPGVKVDSAYAVDRNGLTDDHFVRYPDGSIYRGEVWPGWSHFPDFSRAATRTWWGNWFRDLLAAGIDGFWIDMNEPAVWGQAFPDLVRFDDEGHGASHKKIHNVYGLEMAQATYEGVKRLSPDRRPFVLTRAGFSGVQRYAAVWTGDNVASFEHLRMALTICLELGISGVPFVGADVGGFMDTPTPELFARWIQLGAFTPLFRTHTVFNSARQEPWSFGENVEDISREAISLRYRLLPYFYNAFYQSAQNGLPIMRPLFLDFPDDPLCFTESAQYQFLFGDNLLIAPVVWQGQSLRKLYLPAGKWIDFWSDQIYSGKQFVTVDAPLERLPIFVRTGALIPTQALQQYIDQTPVNEIIWEVYPAESFQYGFYEDDGQSFEYQNGNYSRQQITGRTTNHQLVLTLGNRGGRFRSAVEHYRLQIHLSEKKPLSVTWQGNQLPANNSAELSMNGDWRYDARKKLVELLLPNAAGELKVNW